ncbi:hypothetical protein SAY86_015909 [Trapa natans]|uniref:non-specific serine/threonine protein kinase n=1 Tax=Trapa natans TaxID=22666 RepID=A0AAN7LKJ0_TRANT|nr:hypothetical protein SAY86_015909 [Trapa natans]
MEKNRLPSYLLLFTLFVFFHGVESSFSSSCSDVVCYGVRIKYPFWIIKDDGATTNRGNNTTGSNITCGYQGFGLSCASNKTYPILTLPTDSYYVKDINYTSSILTLIDIDVVGQSCPRARHNLSIDTLPLEYHSDDVNITFYFNCSNDIVSYLPPVSPISCLGKYNNRTSYGVLEGSAAAEEYNWTEMRCDEVVVATVKETEVSETDLIGQFARAMNSGFVLEWNATKDCGACEFTHGRCGFNGSTGQFLCFCDNGSHTYCAAGGIGTKSPLYIGIGVATGGMILFMAIILYCFYKNKLRQVLYKGLETDKEIETFIKHHGSITPKRFSYSQVKSMTDSFVRKLGQGGFGTVYKGKLRDDTLVAVKLLNSSKGNGEEFINEVASISRTSHINIVTLLGFCYEGNKRALIYEFMSNGSLDKFLGNNKNVSTEGINLTWDKLYQIAVGIARGLEYLHKGCNTRILHFDIKPQNILLDDNFCPKISDFGLSKLCLKRESIVSMMAARGTIGYIAPEVFIRNFGDISYKSDVYSYGMMLLEMVRGKNKNSTYEASQSSEVYFQDQVYKLIEDGYGEGIYSQLKDEDKQTVRKMALVGVWCIQTDPKQRPSMGRVIEMLEGSIEAFPIPQKPFLFSPTTSPHHSLSILSST